MKTFMGPKKSCYRLLAVKRRNFKWTNLTDITEYIQEVAGTDAEVIFGHGVDPESR